MKDLQWYKRQEKMLIIEHTTGLAKEWQETFIRDIKLMIPETVNNRLIVSDVWFDMDRIAFVVCTIRCSDRIPMKYEPFSIMYSCYLDLLDMFKEYDEERKNEYLQHVIYEFKNVTSQNVMKLIQFLNTIDNDNKKEEQEVHYCMWGSENGKTY